MSKLNKIRLVALDSDGVLLNDTYSPVIERFVTKHGGEYTAAVERWRAGCRGRASRPSPPSSASATPTSLSTRSR